MNRFRRAACVLDTCSIINLDEIVLARIAVLYHMRQSFDLHVSAVIRDEFRRHCRLVSSREASYWNGVLSNKRYSPRVLVDDASAIGPFFSSPPSFGGPANAGEYANTRVALELLLDSAIGQIIFVTDDEKARNAFLTAIRGSFPGVHLWTSVDVILYIGAILLRQGKADFESVRAALRDVYAAKATKWEELDAAAKSSIIRHQRSTVESLKRLQQVTDHWRK